MESISIRTGKKFTGKFANTAVKIGLAHSDENPEGNEQGETPADPSTETAKAGTITVPDEVKLHLGNKKGSGKSKKTVVKVKTVKQVKKIKK